MRSRTCAYGVSWQLSPKKDFHEGGLLSKQTRSFHLHGSEFGVWFDEECGEAERRDISHSFECCSKVVVLSEEWKEFLLKRHICSLDRIVVVHNAVDVPEVNAIDYSCNTVLFMGALMRAIVRIYFCVLLSAFLRLIPMRVLSLAETGMCQHMNNWRMNLELVTGAAL